MLGRGWGAWLGAGGGSVHLEQTTFGAGTGELGAWIRRGEQHLTLNATTVSTSTVSTIVFGDATVLRVRDPVRYTDVSLTGHGSWRRFDLDAIALSRHVAKGDLAAAPTATVAAAWWATPNVAIAAALGRQLADPMRGTVRARYATLALRLSAERHGPAPPVRTPPPVPIGQASLVTVPAEQGSVLVRVIAPGATRVELMGDVTSWEPRALERRGGRWELRLTTDPGAHHVVVRLDGGSWIVPTNLPRLNDDLGGAVGLIVIP